MLSLRVALGGSLFLAAVLAAGPWLAMQFDSSFPLIELGTLRSWGWLLTLIGFPLLFFSALFALRPDCSREAPAEAGGVFTVAGPYASIRNPLMLSTILLLWGEALIMSRFAMMAYAFLFTWAMHLWVVFYEEPALEARFGSEYEKYCAIVPRWLPKLRKYGDE
jgi:protein-S-isoprenylcysteine O-methyltransferase Ste14